MLGPNVLDARGYLSDYYLPEELRPGDEDKALVNNGESELFPIRVSRF